MECPFVVGQKVVCLRSWEWPIFSQQPKVGAIYTIRDIAAFSGGVGLLFDELINPPHQFANGFVEPYWQHQYFRPLNERTTDISIFQRILDDCSRQKQQENMCC